MTKFIKVTEYDGKNAYIAVEKIVAIRVSHKDTWVCFSMRENDYLVIEETPEQLIQLIKQQASHE
jgi:hypothetical protein